MSVLRMLPRRKLLHFVQAAAILAIVFAAFKILGVVDIIAGGSKNEELEKVSGNILEQIERRERGEKDEYVDGDEWVSLSARPFGKGCQMILYTFLCYLVYLFISLGRRDHIYNK
jgi:hypothetical protein